MFDLQPSEITPVPNDDRVIIHWVLLSCHPRLKDLIEENKKSRNYGLFYTGYSTTVLFAKQAGFKEYKAKWYGGGLVIPKDQLNSALEKLWKLLDELPDSNTNTTTTTTGE